MKKLMLVILSAGVLLAQTNNISGNNFNSNGGDITLNQNNSISKEQIEIDRIIDNDFLKLEEMGLETSEKNAISMLLSQAKEINKLNVPLAEKNRQCKFKAKGRASFFKNVNLEFDLSYCDKIF